ARPVRRRRRGTRRGPSLVRSPRLCGPRLDQGDCLDLDERARWELGDLDGRAGGRLVARLRCVHLVHALEVVEVLEEDGRLDESVEAASGGLQDRTEICERLFGLLLDRLAGDLVTSRLESDLAGNEDEPVRLDRLGIRRALERRGCGLGAYHLFHSSFLLRGRQACASATPSALKIASRTCCVSFPSTSRTCSVRPAVCASSSRKRAARSPASPAIRAWERSTFETSNGRPDASSATCASASSAGTTAEP